VSTHNELACEKCRFIPQPIGDLGSPIYSAEGDRQLREIHAHHQRVCMGWLPLAPPAGTGLGFRAESVATSLVPKK